MIILPVTDVLLSVDPLELTSALLFTVLELPSVNSRKIKLTAFYFLVVAEKALEATVASQQHSYAFPHATMHLSEVDL